MRRGPSRPWVRATHGLASSPVFWGGGARPRRRAGGGPGGVAEVGDLVAVAFEQLGDGGPDAAGAIQAMDEDDHRLALVDVLREEQAELALLGGGVLGGGVGGEDADGELGGVPVSGELVA